MGKKQKSFFEKLTEINASHDESKKQKTVKKAKFSNKKIWFSLGTLGVIVVSVIAIPLAINTSVVNLQPPRSDNDAIITFKDPLGNEVKLTVDQVTKAIKNEQQTNADRISEAYRRAVFFLYDKEQKASDTFQRVWNLSRRVGEAERNDIALKPSAEIRQTQQARIDDIKRNLQNTFGVTNWIPEFQKEIAKDEFGKSTTEKEAVDFLTFKDLEKEALRSFQIETATQTLFSTRIQLDRTATADIFDLDENGNRRLDTNQNPVILYRQGEKVFPEFVENVNYFTSGTSDRITTLKTRSFLRNKWDISPFIDEYLKVNTPYTISNFTFPGVAPTSLTSPWTINKQQFTNFALYSVIDEKITLNGNLISQFKNLEDYVLSTGDKAEKEKALYQNYLNALAIDPDALKTNLGSTGVVSLVSLFNQENGTPVAMSLLTSLFETNDLKLPSIDLNKLFEVKYDTNTKTRIDALLTQARTIQNGTDIKSTDLSVKNAAINKMSDLVSQVNIIIQNYLAQLSDPNFNELVGSVYRDNIVKTVANRPYTSFAYNINGVPGLKAVLTPTGITLVRYKKIETKEQYLNLIKSDFQNLSNGSTAYFKALEAINVDTANQNVVLGTLLEDNEFVNDLKTHVNVHSVDGKSNFNDTDIVNLKNITASIIKGSKTNAAYTGLQKVEQWLKTTINSQASYNFTLKDGKFYIDFNKASSGSLSSMPAKDIILNRIFVDFKLPGGSN